MSEISSDDNGEVKMYCNPDPSWAKFGHPELAERKLRWEGTCYTCKHFDKKQGYCDAYKLFINNPGYPHKYRIPNNSPRYELCPEYKSKGKLKPVAVQDPTPTTPLGKYEKIEKMVRHYGHTQEDAEDIMSLGYDIIKVVNGQPTNSRWYPKWDEEERERLDVDEEEDD